MEDALLGFVCSETIVPTPSESATTTGRCPTKELEETRPLIIEGEPIEELEEEPQADQVVTRSISRASEERRARSERRIQFKCRSAPYKTPTSVLAIPEMVLIVITRDRGEPEQEAPV